MKRKFSINPLPVMASARVHTGRQVWWLTVVQKKTMSKADLNAPKHVTRSPLTSPMAYDDNDPRNDVCDFSPFINRRALTVQTEKELREACGYVLQNFKPSGHGLQDTDPKLDFGAMSRRAQGRKPTVAEIHIKKPTGAPEDMIDSYAKGRACTNWELTARSQPLQPLQPNMSQQRADSGKRKASFAWMQGQNETARPQSSKTNASNRAMSRTQTNVDAMAASRTGSTSGPCHFASAAAPASGWASNRGSRQLDSPAAVADAQAMEWMRHELNKTTRPPTTEPGPPLSRAQSIMNRLGRAASREPLQKADTHVAPEKRSGSSNTWRRWSLPHRSSSRSSSRPSTVRADADEARPRQESEVDLNRQLPPLPSLDTWREPVWSPQAEETIPLSPTHTSPRQHRRATSDISMMQSADIQPTSPDHVRPGSSHSGTTAQPRRLLRKINTGTAPGHLKLMMGEWTSPTTTRFDRSNKPGASDHAYQTGADSVVASPNTDTSSQSPTYSRNMGLDASPQKKVPHEEQKSRLRRVFSGWMLKKERKDDWMHKIEKQGGGREGLLIQDGSGVTPVMRY